MCECDAKLVYEGDGVGTCYDCGEPVAMEEPPREDSADSEATTTPTAGEAQPINEDVSEPPKEVK